MQDHSRDRLKALKEEFKRLEGHREEYNQSESNDMENWIDNIQEENTRKTQKMHRDNILKYLEYIVSLAEDL